MKTKGFTLIELLVVISIIGVLSTMIFSAIGDIRDRAKIARVISDLQQIERALQMTYLETGCWPRGSSNNGCPEGFLGTEIDSPVGYNPNVRGNSIQNAVNANKTFSKYLSRAPVFPFAHDGFNYVYHNNNIPHDPDTCSGSTNNARHGVNIIIVATPPNPELSKVFSELDRRFDGTGGGGNVAFRCGKIRWRDYAEQGAALFYSISNHPLHWN